jgi:hypothetical protein
VEEGLGKESDGGDCGGGGLLCYGFDFDSCALICDDLCCDHGPDFYCGCGS